MNAGELAEGHAPLRGEGHGFGPDRWVRAPSRRFPPTTLIRASGARTVTQQIPSVDTGNRYLPSRGPTPVRQVRPRRRSSTDCQLFELLHRPVEQAAPQARLRKTCLT